MTNLTNTNNKLIIVASAIRTVAGDEPFLNYAAIATNLNHAAPSDSFDQPNKKEIYEPIFVNTIKDLDLIESQERLHFHLEEALIELLEIYEGLLSEKRLLIYILVPATTTPRGASFDYNYIHDELKYIKDHFPQVSVKLIPLDKANAIEVLQNLAEKLFNNEIDYVIYGGADSLIDPATVGQNAMMRTLHTTESADGLVLSEGAGFILLCSQKMLSSEKSNGNKLDQLGIIGGIATEYNKSSQNHEDLENSINAVLTQSSLEIGQVDQIYHSFGASSDSQLEWYKLSKKLWPVELSERQRSALMLGEINSDDINKLSTSKIAKQSSIHISLGEVGAASFPLSIIMACGGFENDQCFCDFKFSKDDHSLVCDSSADKARGAILVSAPNSNISRLQINLSELESEEI
ncbi:hypothetical protein MNBD_GAMMA12-2384 [hydrothermal vent metagenome]|uniref:Beta-ketoacyl synthase-like N-terminal domain-containing protein n=1 Tax=hydrothermal vent metagenome TaxID=652676 RepID=A0A3B0Y5T9_9ZZZZ